jgi:Uma2 family endonuclease
MDFQAFETEVVADYETERSKPMPSLNHSIIQSRLNIALGRYANQFEILPELNLAPPGVKPSVPDLCIYPKMEVDLLNDEIKVTDAPITAIEILSPKQSIDDVKEKIFEIYFPAGAKSAWLVIPTFRTVYVFSPDRKYAAFTSGTLHDPATGISLELDSFFP